MIRSSFPYNINKAVEYANTYCDSNNPDYFKYSADCANFVSQCLIAKIMEELITPLYELSKERKMPMTKLVNRIIREYLKKTELKSKKATVVRDVKV